MYPSSSSAINMYNIPILSPPLQYEDEHIFFQHIHSLILQQQQEGNFDNIVPTETITNTTFSNSNSISSNSISSKSNNESGSNNSNNVNVVMMMKNNGDDKPQQKGSKKDRHSKIHTAQGPRDRRMRLSLDVARKFFDLQDMLGFDKASKTVDWLLGKSKLAIKDLKQQKLSSSSSTTTPSPASECDPEAASGVLDQEFEPPIGKIEGKSVGRREGMNGEKKAGGKTGRVRAAFHPQVKESRNKARERARERTKKKNSMLGETTQAAGCSDRAPPPPPPASAAGELNCGWAGLQNIFNPSATSHDPEHQFADFPYCTKFWEDYNRNNGNL